MHTDDSLVVILYYDKTKQDLLLNQNWDLSDSLPLDSSSSEHLLSACVCQALLCAGACREQNAKFPRPAPRPAPPPPSRAYSGEAKVMAILTFMRPAPDPPPEVGPSSELGSLRCQE